MAKKAALTAAVPLLILLLPVGAEPAHAANTICPAVGNDSDCGAIVTVTDTGATITITGQGPYDGDDDTLVGVVNNSKLPVSALNLSSSANIFGFDGDGVDTFGVAGNAKDASGYGGPNAYYTNVGNGATTGTVHFITPIAATGGTSFFSLENALDTATACSDIINKSVTTDVKGPVIKATFTPNDGFTLAQAEAVCGFKRFDWIQTFVTLPDPSPYEARNLNGGYNPKVTGAVSLGSKDTPFNDPPQGGGYTYSDDPDYSYPFYYDPNVDLPDHEETSALTFRDLASDPCLPGGTPGTHCNGKNAPNGSFLEFTTHLAGINQDGTARDLKVGFHWTSTFNGTSGGVATSKNDQPADPGGTGGVTIVDVTDTTDYDYQGFTVTTVTDVPPAPTPSPSSTINGAGGLPVTGDRTGVIAASGLALVVAGAATLLILRRRRSMATRL
jgi:LPXTG-motif cell wall-anchored protein